MPEYVSYHFRVHGRVQGVGFRRFVKKLAQEHQIGGWVKNNHDGTVSVEALGRDDEVRNFVDFVKRGSFFSRVDEIEEIAKTTLSNRPESLFEIKF